MLTLIPAFQIPAHASPAEVEARILRAVAFVKEEYYSSGNFSGFLHSTVGNESARSYAEDDALIVMTLSSYQETHITTAFYADLKNAVQSLLQLQSAQGDFHQYYDFQNSTRGPSGRLYYWNAYAIMGVGYAAYVVTEQNNTESDHWLSVVDRLRLCIDTWLPRSQTQSGAVIFAFPDGANRADVDYNGALLMGLIHIAAFEYLWGSRNIAETYGQYSKRIADWLLKLQERDPSSWGNGGFYSDESRNLQTTSRNAFAMFGINSYYKGIGLLLPNQRTSLEGLRLVMQDWAQGYVEKIMDASGGTSYGRNASGLIPYPKLTQTTSVALAAMVDVWIDLGPPVYWDDCSRLYGWIVGSNKQAVDMQTDSGGFYAGLDSSGILSNTDLTTTALTLYSLIRAQYVSIPGTYPIQRSSTATEGSTTIVNQSAARKTQAAVTNSASQVSSTGPLVLGVAGLVVLGIGAGLYAFRLRGRKRTRRDGRRRLRRC